MFLNKLEEEGYYVLISNDYDEILMTIVGYFQQNNKTDQISKTETSLLTRCIVDVYRRLFT